MTYSAPTSPIRTDRGSIPSRRLRRALATLAGVATIPLLTAPGASAAPQDPYPFAAERDPLALGGAVRERGPLATTAADENAPPEQPPERDAAPEKPKRFKLSNERTLSRFAFVERKTWARAKPQPNGNKILKLKRTHSGGASELVLLLRGRRTGSGTWYKARLPMRPNGTTGWVRGRDLSDLYRVRTQLTINRKSKRAVLRRGGKRVWKARVGVGKPGTITPSGRFYVRDRVIPYDKKGIYGKFAFGLSAHAPTLSDWPGGGIVGIHGTNQPGLIPGAVSHGCIRLKNKDVVRLKRKMPLGTPVRIK